MCVYLDDAANGKENVYDPIKMNTPSLEKHNNNNTYIYIYLYGSKYTV